MELRPETGHDRAQAGTPSPAVPLTGLHGVSNRALAAGLFLITLLPYLQTLRFDFVRYDDPQCVTEVAEVRDGLTWRGIAWAFQSVVLDHWKPLTSLSHMLDCELFGLNAGGHHAVNVLWHAATAVMLFVALLELTGKPWRSVLVAALFAWHPLRVESVAWVTERKDVLSGFFWMAAIWAYARHVRMPSRSRLALAVGLLAVGLLAKSSLVTLPCVLVLLDFWPLGRLRLGSNTASSTAGIGTGHITLGTSLREKLPFFAVSIAAAVTAVSVATALPSTETLSIQGRLSNAVVSYARYLGMTFWPVDLAVLYPHPGRWTVWAWAGALALVTGITWVAWRRTADCPALLVGWLWFLGTLVPMIGLVQAGGQSLADRYTYLPQVGLFITIVWVAADAAEGTRNVRKLCVVAAGVLVACLVMSGLQARHWADSYSLFEHAAKVTRNNHIAHGNLGFLHLQDGRPEAALPHLQEAARIIPANADFRYNLGIALDKLGRTAEAAVQLREAVRLNADFLNAHRQLASAERRLGRLDEAAAHLRHVARLEPTASAHIELGVVLAQSGRAADAAAAYVSALALNAREPVAHANLAALLTESGELDRAAQHFAEALRLQPTNAVTRYNFALLLLRNQRDPEAVEQLRESVRLQPGAINTLNRLAWVLATSPVASARRGAEALQLATLVHEQTGRRQAMAFDTLGAALAENGRFEEAVAAAQQAASLAAAARQTNLATAATARAAVYQAGRAFRDTPESRIIPNR